MSLVEARDRWLERLRERGACRGKLLEAFRSVPREAFLPETLREVAYVDQARELWEHQGVSFPSFVAQMVEALELCGSERVLEVGTGRGYSAAVLSRMVREVYTIERDTVLAANATAELARSGFRNVHVRCGDGSMGWRERAPFEAIVVDAAAPEIPGPRLAQLCPGGRLVIPIGSDVEQVLVRVTREGSSFRREKLGLVRTRRLIGALGYPEPSEDSRVQRRPSSSIFLGGLLRQSALRH